MIDHRPSLLLLHGFAQTPASWDGVVAALPLGYDVHAIELPGHGATGLSLGKPSVAIVRDFVAGAITERCGGRTAVWGYSQGGRVAFDLALHRPELVDSLVVESAQPGIRDPLERADRRSRDEALASRIEAGSIEDFMRTWESVPALVGQPADVVESQRAMRRSQEPAALAAALRGIGQAAYASMWDRLGELTMPLLAISGERDEVYCRVAETVAAAVANGRHATIAGAGHGAHIERPEATSSMVASFLMEVLSVGDGFEGALMP